MTMPNEPGLEKTFVRCKLPWLIAGGAAAGLVLVVVAARGGQAASHPQPRIGVTAERVLPPAVVPNTPNAAEAYAAARSAPAVLDGIYVSLMTTQSHASRLAFATALR